MKKCNATSNNINKLYKCEQVKNQKPGLLNEQARKVITDNNQPHSKRAVVKQEKK
eukprot:m.101331 g.101331  ORF g.101331 m.101331 type:complete len:55 (-) comp14972_c1_seq1:190-354(-)